MKSIYFNTLTHKCTAWLFFAVLCVGVTGCKKDLQPIVTHGEPVYINLSTKSSELLGTNINSVRIILVDRYGYIKYNWFHGDANYTPWQMYVETGIYDMHVIANEEYDRGYNWGLNDIHTHEDLLNVHLSYDLSNRDFTNIPMIASYTGIRIAEPISGVSSPDNPGSIRGNKVFDILFQRLVSKISVTLNYSSIESARIKNIPTSIPLFSYSNPVGKQEININSSSFIPQYTPDTDQPSMSGFYTVKCENILVPSVRIRNGSDFSNVLLFEFRTNSGQSFYKYLYDSNGSGISRNHHYLIDIKVIDNLVFDVLTPLLWGSTVEDVEIL